MTDLDELRRALRAQESLAPDPDAVLAVATRRIRRRRTTSVAAVTLTVAALGAGAVGLLDRGTAVVPPATLASPPSATVTQPPAAGKVPPAAPAISLEDSSWDLTMWAVQPHIETLHYAQNHSYAFTIESRGGTAPHSALATKPSTADRIPHPQSVMWQDGPDHWIRVTTTKPVTAPEMLALLGKIHTTPPMIASPLKSLQVPDGQQVGTFTSEPETNTLVLCPPAEVGKTPLDPRCFSLTVSLTGRAADGGYPQDPLPVHQHRTLGAYTIEIDSSPAHAKEALTLLDSVQLNR
ncbi:hypothetical protein [Amycolatopsis sp. WQ 127309]|uniref:hypothetical protein n=1 Tax=Amycolatopsis sp. WQ 127309 TaxID=2932773 RepID=UPI001FF6850F|nr:hypothetical protein [Amycolatopsis sp. WQ 127309]UOZ05466.1 hypothetical protein MUY22_42645 [Amycolatopsis sp. WQ 127309]